MLRIDPEYINIFTKHWSFPIGKVLLILLGIYIICRMVFTSSDDNPENEFFYIMYIKFPMASIIAVTLCYLPPINGPAMNQAISEYQANHKTEIRTNHDDFNKEKGNLPEFSETTLIKTKDGLFQSKLETESIEQVGIKKVDIDTSGLSNNDNDNNQKKNYTLNIIELPNDTEQPITTMVKVFKDKRLEGKYIIETNYETLSYIIRNKRTIQYDEKYNKLRFK